MWIYGLTQPMSWITRDAVPREFAMQRSCKTFLATVTNRADDGLHERTVKNVLRARDLTGQP
jgi:hypothetical protein